MRQHLWPLISADGVVAPVVHAQFPIADVAEAHALLDGPETVGKVVLRIR